MRIGKTILDLENLTENDLTEVIKEAKRLRSRKADSRALHEGFAAMLASAKERKLSLCSKYTGEVLNADDWVVYDEEDQCVQHGEWYC